MRGASVCSNLRIEVRFPFPRRSKPNCPLRRRLIPNTVPHTPSLTNLPNESKPSNKNAYCSRREFPSSSSHSFVLHLHGEGKKGLKGTYARQRARCVKTTDRTLTRVLCVVCAAPAFPAPSQTPRAEPTPAGPRRACCTTGTGSGGACIACCPSGWARRSSECTSDSLS